MLCRICCAICYAQHATCHLRQHMQYCIICAGLCYALQISKIQVIWHMMQRFICHVVHDILLTTLYVTWCVISQHMIDTKSHMLLQCTRTRRHYCIGRGVWMSEVCRMSPKVTRLLPGTHPAKLLLKADKMEKKKMIEAAKRANKAKTDQESGTKSTSSGGGGNHGSGGSNPSSGKGKRKRSSIAGPAVAETCAAQTQDPPIKELVSAKASGATRAMKAMKAMKA